MWRGHAIENGKKRIELSVAIGIAGNVRAGQTRPGGSRGDSMAERAQRRIQESRSSKDLRVRGDERHLHARGFLICLQYCAVFLFPLECPTIHRSSFAPPHACASEAPLEIPADPLPGNDFPSWSQGPAGGLNLG